MIASNEWVSTLWAQTTVCFSHCARSYRGTVMCCTTHWAWGDVTGCMAGYLICTLYSMLNSKTSRTAWPLTHTSELGVATTASTRRDGNSTRFATLHTVGTTVRPTYEA